MYLKRFVYDRLLDWKNEGGHSTLEVGGARQVGKTYLIQKFADENYKHKIYINLFELSGKQFMECYKQATDWTPGTKRREHPLHDAFQLYEPDFIDSEDTVIIIDEIQESSEIITVSGSLHVTLKPISSSLEAILDGFMIQNFVIPVVMSQSLLSTHFLLRNF